jgi:hypothetical protein
LLPQFGLLSTASRGTITSDRDVERTFSTPLVEIGEGQALVLSLLIDARRFDVLRAAD